MNRTIAFGRLSSTFVALLVLLVGVAVAYAAPAGSSAILGCAKEPNGQLRIVGDASQCGPGERLIEFQASIPASQSVLVDCTKGERVSDALAQTAVATGVVITIKGTCSESVTVARDNVTLQGDGSGGTIQKDSGKGPAIWIPGARNVAISRLTLLGGAIGAAGGALFSADRVVMLGPGAGISVTTGATGTLVNSTVDGFGRGVSVSQGGSLSITGASTIRSSGDFNVEASNGGSVVIGGGGKFGGVPLITDSGHHGVIAGWGGSITIGNAVVQNSAGTGVFAFQGGSVFVMRDTLIQGNARGGVAALGADAEVDGRVTRNFEYGVSGFNGGRLTIQDGAVIDDNAGPGVVL